MESNKADVKTAHGQMVNPRNSPVPGRSSVESRQGCDNSSITTRPPRHDMRFRLKSARPNPRGRYPQPVGMQATHCQESSTRQIYDSVRTKNLMLLLVKQASAPGDHHPDFQFRIVGVDYAHGLSSTSTVGFLRCGGGTIRPAKNRCLAGIGFFFWSQFFTNSFNA